jgi:hypothetical protein
MTSSYARVPTTDPNAPGPSASSSLSSSPLQHAIATLHPHLDNDDQPYELDEKASFLPTHARPPHRQSHHARSHHPGLSWLSPTKREQTHAILTNAAEMVQRTKTYVLLGVCALLALLLLLDRSTASTAPVAATASASVPTSSMSTAAPRLEDDIVLITKVGSATVHSRLLIHLAEQPLSNVYAPNRLYVSDATMRVGEIELYDALANVSDTIRSLDEFSELRAQLSTLHHGNQDLGAMHDKDGGWKLDKYKFLPMLAEAWRRFPHKQWYVVVEADTFVFWNQLVRWLATLDARRQLMLGHPTFCDYDGESTMFTHGGSGFVLSGALVAQSFGKDADFEHHHDELIQKSAFGDALLSKALYDTPGVTLKELSPDGRERFNSDPPRVLKFHRGNWCEPLLTLHHVTPADTAHLYRFARRIDARLGEHDSVRWGDIWDEFLPDFLRVALLRGGEDGDEGGNGVSISGWQAIEDWDSETTDVATASPEQCQSVCATNEGCVLWQWQDTDSKRKRAGAPAKGLCRWTKEFLRIGVTKPDEPAKTTGWMPARVREWQTENACPGHTSLWQQQPSLHED